VRSEALTEIRGVERIERRSIPAMYRVIRIRRARWTTPRAGEGSGITAVGTSARMTFVEATS
jgi:hypothetical protein